jgi:hypothetical protein
MRAETVLSSFRIMILIGGEVVANLALSILFDGEAVGKGGKLARPMKVAGR